jgi:hypothetical protein
MIAMIPLTSLVFRRVGAETGIVNIMQSNLREPALLIEQGDDASVLLT